MDTPLSTGQPNSINATLSSHPLPEQAVPQWTEYVIHTLSEEQFLHRETGQLKFSTRWGAYSWQSQITNDKAAVYVIHFFDSQSHLSHKLNPSCPESVFYIITLYTIMSVCDKPSANKSLLKNTNYNYHILMPTSCWQQNGILNNSCAAGILNDLEALSSWFFLDSLRSNL